VRLFPDGRCLVSLNDAVIEFDTAGREARRSTMTSSGITPFGATPQPQIGPDGMVYTMGWRDYPPGLVRPASATFEREPDYVPHPASRLHVRRSGWDGTKQGEIALQAESSGAFSYLPSGELFAVVVGKGGTPLLAEFDRHGRRLRTFRHEAQAAARLWNGDTLVIADRPVELDPDGRVVWHAVLGDWVRHAGVLYPLLRFGFRPAAGAERPDAECVAGWVAALDDERVEVRRWAASRLYAEAQARGPLRGKAQQSVISRLRDGDAEVRASALKALGEANSYRHVPDAAIPNLVGLLRAGKNPLIELAAASPSAVPPLLELASSAEADRRSAQRRADALWILCRHAIRDKDARAARAVTAGLSDEDADVRLRLLDGIAWNAEPSGGRASLWEMTRKGRRHSQPECVPFVAKLVRMAEGKDDKEADAALLALGAAGDAAGDAVPALLRLLNKPQRSLSALRCLGCVGGNSADRVVPVLRKHVDQRNDTATCAAAVEALAKFGAKKETIDALIEALKDERTDRRNPSYAKPVRRSALFWLEVIGPAAKKAVPALLAVAKDRKEAEDFRRSAFAALKEIGDESAVPGLVALFKDETEEREQRKQAIDAVGEIGGKSAIDALRLLLRDEVTYQEMRSRAWSALGLAAKKVNKVPAELVTVAKDKRQQEEDRAGAMRALGTVGGKDAASTLLAIARDRKDSEKLRTAALQALARTGKAAVPALLGFIRDGRESDELRTWASVELFNLDREAWRKEDAAVRKR
jgi:HEAT repeat protein